MNRTELKQIVGRVENIAKKCNEFQRYIKKCEETNVHIAENIMTGFERYCARYDEIDVMLEMFGYSLITRFKYDGTIKEITITQVNIKTPLKIATITL